MAGVLRAASSTLGLSCSSRCTTPQAAPLIATCELIYFHAGMMLCRPPTPPRPPRIATALAACLARVATAR